MAPRRTRQWQCHVLLLIFFYFTKIKTFEYPTLNVAQHQATCRICILRFHGIHLILMSRMCPSIATFTGTWIEATATTNSLKISCQICNPSRGPDSPSPDGLKCPQPHCRLLFHSLKMTLKFRNIPLPFIFGSLFLLLSIFVRMPDIASRYCWLPA